MSKSVVYDCLQRYCIADNGKLVEGYEGYRIIEDYSVNGQAYVVYGMISDTGSTERLFGIHSQDILRFMQLHAYYCNEVHKKNMLLTAAFEVMKNGELLTSDHIGVIQDVYNKYRLHFVAMNLKYEDFRKVIEEYNIPSNFSTKIVS